MRIEQHLGLLQEELHKYNYEIEVFDQTYLIDKVIEYAATINREAIKAHEDHSSLFSLIDMDNMSIDANHKLSSENIVALIIPKLLSGVLYKNTNGLTLLIEGVFHNVGRNTILNLLTGEFSRYSSDSYGYAIEGSNLLIKNIGTLGINDNIILEAILDDQRALCGTDAEILAMDLKVASDAKLHMLINKEIVTLISEGQNGNTDSNRSESK